MHKKKNKIESDNSGGNPDEEIYEIFNETDEEIILKINRRKDENKALKKLLENLNTTLPVNKNQKKV